MIITRTPLRISLGGGGTDLPSYYRSRGGFVVAAAITKHIYVAVHRNFEPAIFLKYSAIERVAEVADVQHPLIREALLHSGISSAIEVSSMADIPAGTGLGSSGAFAVGLVKALLAYQHRFASNADIAEIACHLEIERLGEPIGKQDQYIAALGGITALEFRTDNTVVAHPISMADGLRQLLQENLLLFYTGVRRSASDELRALDGDAKLSDSDMTKNLDEVKQSGYRSAEALERGDLDTFAKLLSEQWELKYTRSPSAVHETVDGWIQRGVAAGALGGKLVGAGGGGFLLFFAERKSELRAAMSELGLPEVDFAIDYLGTSVVVQ
jgi:D-glycero-alpha-D-manno-heptose-7-phosphate kinase